MRTSAGGNLLLAADAFGNALGNSIAGASGDGSQQLAQRSSWLENSYAQTAVADTMTDAPAYGAEPVRDVVRLRGEDPEADAISRQLQAEYEATGVHPNIPAPMYSDDYEPSDIVYDSNLEELNLRSRMPAANASQPQATKLNAVKTAAAAQGATDKARAEHDLAQFMAVARGEKVNFGPVTERGAGGSYVNGPGGAALGYLPGGRSADADAAYARAAAGKQAALDWAFEKGAVAYTLVDVFRPGSPTDAVTMLAMAPLGLAGRGAAGIINKLDDVANKTEGLVLRAELKRG